MQSAIWRQGQKQNTDKHNYITNALHLSQQQNDWKRVLCTHHVYDFCVVNDKVKEVYDKWCLVEYISRIRWHTQIQQGKAFHNWGKTTKSKRLTVTGCNLRLWGCGSSHNPSTKLHFKTSMLRGEEREVPKFNCLLRSSDFTEKTLNYV